MDGEPGDSADDPADDGTRDAGDAAAEDRGSSPLAAIVDKPGTEVAIAALQDEGVYDPDRRIREYDDGTVALPVTDPPRADVLDVVRQREPELRTRDLSDLLRERGWSDDEIAAAPASWAVIGTVVLVDVPPNCPDEAAVGEALLELHREADTVLAREGIEGPTRDPRRRVIAGIGDTETVHTEFGVRYALDLDSVMFSPGNAAERARMAGLVAAGRNGDGNSPADRANDGDWRPVATIDTVDLPEDVTRLDPAPDDDLEAVGGPSEHVFDMFAGAGYFTLPAAIAGARVSAAEIDPDTFQYLIENAQLNGVGDRVGAYLADCREVALSVEADRVIMGHFDADEYLAAAFEAVRDGGVVHYHDVAPESELPDRPTAVLEAAADGTDREVDVLDVRRVKSYGEGVWHVVADARVV